MNVLLLPADAHGCGYYRMRMPAHYAESDTTINDRIAVRDDGSIDVGASDVVVFQRPLHHRMPVFIRRLQRQGVAVVVEIDDDLAALDAHHVAYANLHPRLSPESNWQHLKTACAAADLVTVSTSALASRYAAHGRYLVLRNYVESALTRYRPEQREGFGWAGYVPTHPGDLRMVGTAVRDLVREGHRFRVIGPGLGVRTSLCLDDEPDATGWLELEDYYRSVSELRVGMVPLADSAFNRGKSWLKGLEYAALGVPFVASPTWEYKQLQNEGGAGQLASSPRQWRSKLHRLLTDDNVHAELAEHARSCVAANLTIEDNAWRWDEAWELACRNRRIRAANPAHAA